MDYTPPPQYHQESFEPASFRPGNLNQDIYTIPLEVGLIASLNYFYTPRSKTLFPAFDEATHKTNNATTLGRSFLLPYALGSGIFVFGGLKIFNNNFQLFTHLRGFTHSILLNELSTSATKVIAQKKRPNYDAQVSGNNGKDNQDSRASFYSGHSSHAFGFATYTSLLMFEYANSPVVATIYSVCAYSAASYIGYSRVVDHAHNLSDVIVGGIMGTLISGLTFFRVETVSTKNSPPAQLVSFTPAMGYDETGKLWVEGNVRLVL